jgi:hypothetical protein
MSVNCAEYDSYLNSIGWTASVVGATLFTASFTKIPVCGEWTFSGRWGGMVCGGIVLIHGIWWLTLTAGEVTGCVDADGNASPPPPTIWP